MPDNILSDFFYGNLVPSDKEFARDSEFGKAVDELSKKETVLRTKLDGEAAELFDMVCQLQGNVTEMTAKEYYIDGFRTGFRLAVSALFDGDKPLLK